MFGVVNFDGFGGFGGFGRFGGFGNFAPMALRTHPKSLARDKVQTSLRPAQSGNVTDVLHGHQGTVTTLAKSASSLTTLPKLSPTTCQVAYVQKLIQMRLRI